MPFSSCRALALRNLLRAVTIALFPKKWYRHADKQMTSPPLSKKLPGLFIGSSYATIGGNLPGASTQDRGELLDERPSFFLGFSLEVQRFPNERLESLSTWIIPAYNRWNRNAEGGVND